MLSTDLITPSIPDLPEALGTSIGTAQMTVSVNLAAYAIAQLVHGPVADAIGRKRLLISAFLLFAIFSVYCALAITMQGLLWGRFAQGLFSSVPSVVIVLLIRELYDSNRALAVMGLYGATLGVAPAVGP
ncbi:MAG: MFS transporter, partial [Pseudomonadota bacterium]